MEYPKRLLKFILPTLLLWSSPLPAAHCGRAPASEACQINDHSREVLEQSSELSEIGSYSNPLHALGPGGLLKKLLTLGTEGAVRLLSEQFGIEKKASLELMNSLSTLKPALIAGDSELRELLMREAQSITPQESQRLLKLVQNLKKTEKKIQPPEALFKAQKLHDYRKIISDRIHEAGSSRELAEFRSQLDHLIFQATTNPEGVAQLLSQLLSQIEPAKLKLQANRETLILILQTTENPSNLNATKIAKTINSINPLQTDESWAQLREPYAQRLVDLINNHPQPAQPAPSGTSVFSTKAAPQWTDEVRPYTELDPKKWQGVLPEWIFTNASVPKNAWPTQPLRGTPNLNRRTTFLHGTTPEARDQIQSGTFWLTPGMGDVSAGFFLDLTGGTIANTYAKKGGVMLEVSLTPEARTVDFGSQFWREIDDWIRSEDATPTLKRLHPEFYKLLKRDGRHGISRDNLARAFGAQVLINRVNYGGSTFSEVVVLDPSVVTRVRERK
jgi:hypothetical protein